MFHRKIGNCNKTKIEVYTNGNDEDLQNLPKLFVKHNGVTIFEIEIEAGEFHGRAVIDAFTVNEEYYLL